MEQIEGEKEWFKCESVRMEGWKREQWSSLSVCTHPSVRVYIHPYWFTLMCVKKKKKKGWLPASLEEVQNSEWDENIH